MLFDVINQAVKAGRISVVEKSALTGAMTLSGSATADETVVCYHRNGIYYVEDNLPWVSKIYDETVADTVTNATLLPSSDTDYDDNATTKITRFTITKAAYDNLKLAEKEKEKIAHQHNLEKLADEIYDFIRNDKALDQTTGSFALNKFSGATRVKLSPDDQSVVTGLITLKLAQEHGVNRNDLTVKKENAEENWLITAKLIGLSDGIWASLLSMINMKVGGDKVMAFDIPGIDIGGLAILNGTLPLLLGPLTGLNNYYAQLAWYRKTYGCEPTAEFEQKVRLNSMALSFKVSSAIGGWMLGYEFAGQIASLGLLLDPTGTGHAANASIAFIVGLCAGIALVFSAVIAHHANPETKNTPLKVLDLVKLFAAGFVAGFAWQMINAYTFVSPSALGANGMFEKVMVKLFDYFLKGLATAPAVATAFALMKPTQVMNEANMHSNKLALFSPAYFSPKKTEIAMQDRAKLIEMPNLVGPRIS